jgi:hypothetical protein
MYVCMYLCMCVYIKFYEYLSGGTYIASSLSSFIHNLSFSQIFDDVIQNLVFPVQFASAFLLFVVVTLKRCPFSIYPTILHSQ